MFPLSEDVYSERQFVIVHVRACVASHVSLRILRCSKASRPRELRDISTSRPSMMSRRKGRALRMTRWDSTPSDRTTPFSSWDKRDMLWERETRDRRSGNQKLHFLPSVCKTKFRRSTVFDLQAFKLHGMKHIRCKCYTMLRD